MSRPKRNFAPMPLAVLVSDASPKAKLLILVLMQHDWEGVKAWPSQARIAKLMSLKKDSVSSATKECVERGWIVVKRRFSASSMYDIDIPDMNLDQFEEALNNRHLSEIPITDKTHLTCRKNPPHLSEFPELTESKGTENKEKNQEYSDAFFTAYELKYGSKPHPPKSAFVNLASLIKSGITKEDFKNRVDAYFKAEWPPQKDFQGLLTHWDKFASIKAYMPKNPGDPGYLPPAMRPRV